MVVPCIVFKNGAQLSAEIHSAFFVANRIGRKRSLSIRGCSVSCGVFSGREINRVQEKKKETFHGLLFCFPVGPPEAGGWRRRWRSRSSCSWSFSSSGVNRKVECTKKRQICWPPEKKKKKAAKEKRFGFGKGRSGKV